MNTRANLRLALITVLALALIITIAFGMGTVFARSTAKEAAATTTVTETTTAPRSTSSSTSSSTTSSTSSSTTSSTIPTAITAYPEPYTPSSTSSSSSPSRTSTATSEPQPSKKMPPGWGTASGLRGREYGLENENTISYSEFNAHLKKYGGFRMTGSEDSRVQTKIGMGYPVWVRGAGEERGAICTIGDVIYSPDNEPYLVIAGHCLLNRPGDITDVEVYNGDGSRYLGQGFYAVNDDTADVDYGLVSVSHKVAAEADTVRYFPDARVVNGKLLSLEPGDEVCNVGATTGLSCGKLLNATQYAGSANYYSGVGDSGGVVFAKRGNTIYVIGVTARVISTRPDIDGASEVSVFTSAREYRF